MRVCNYAYIHDAYIVYAPESCDPWSTRIYGMPHVRHHILALPGLDDHVANTRWTNVFVATWIALTTDACPGHRAPGQLQTW